MKSHKNLVRITLGAAAIILTSAGAANAQLSDPVTFTTTFPFVAGGKTMPPGRYTATPMTSDPSILQISNGRTGVMMLTENDRPKVQPRQDEVTFVKRGDTYVLQEIWDAALSVGVEPAGAHVVQHAARHAKAK
jgi:hypothetical protein